MAIGNPIKLTGNVTSKMTSVIATDGQTLFTVNGGYRINQIAVFRNGVRLTNQSDFIAQDGATVVLSNAAAVDDEILFEIFDDFRVADAIVSYASTQTINGDLSITGNLYYQGSGSGILTTAGDGSQLTGIVTSITAGDNISVSGSTGNVTITGLANTANVIADTLVVSGVSTLGSVNATSGSFSGNVSIAGTLTYEDVTNVDSVGLITARSGINVTSGGMDVTGGIDATGTVNFSSGGLNVTGVVSATSFTGDGSGLTGVESWNQLDTWLYSP